MGHGPRWPMVCWQQLRRRLSAGWLGGDAYGPGPGTGRFTEARGLASRRPGRAAHELGSSLQADPPSPGAAASSGPGPRSRSAVHPILADCHRGLLRGLRCSCGPGRPLGRSQGRDAPDAGDTAFLQQGGLLDQSTSGPGPNAGPHRRISAPSLALCPAGNLRPHADLPRLPASEGRPYSLGPAGTGPRLAPGQVLPLPLALALLRGGHRGRRRRRRAVKGSR